MSCCIATLYLFGSWFLRLGKEADGTQTEAGTKARGERTGKEKRENPKSKRGSREGAQGVSKSVLIFNCALIKLHFQYAALSAH